MLPAVVWFVWDRVKKTKPNTQAKGNEAKHFSNTLVYLQEEDNAATAFAWAVQAVPQHGHRDTGNKGFHKLIDLGGKINMVTAKALFFFYRFIDLNHNQCPEFIKCSDLEQEECGKCQLALDYIQNILFILVSSVNSSSLGGRIGGIFLCEVCSPKLQIASLRV